MIDIAVEELVIEEDRPEHIAKHNITIEEVIEVTEGNYVFIQGKLNRWILIGKTKRQRFIAVVVGEREKENTYGLVTARPARKNEKNIYIELEQHQGGENE